jgi:hypothetical protein
MMTDRDLTGDATVENLIRRGWDFGAREISNSHWVFTASHQLGPQVSSEGEDPEALRQECVRVALEFQGQIDERLALRKTAGALGTRLSEVGRE